MEFRIGNTIVNSYKRLAYREWYALAEFVDNSTQAYFNNKEDLDAIYKIEKDRLKVDIFYDSENDSLTIEDNSIGMTKDELQNALTVGLPPENTEGRSRYGLGLKTAACWFGDEWTIYTSKLGSDKSISVTIELEQIMESAPGKPVKLKINEETAETTDHFTKIEIRRLNRKMKTRTISKVRDYLSSIYRLDFREYGLQLLWQGQRLKWQDIDSKLYVNEDGKPLKQKIDFTLENGKRVAGWAGVLGPGHAGRKQAGFSLIVARRVIQGWPRAFKPSTIFGDLEDGENNLVNQRLVGELFLDGFEVSHTKDEIIWLDDEFDEVEQKLGSILNDLRYAAETLRFKSTDTASKLEGFQSEAVSTVTSELKSNEISSYISDVELLEEEFIHNIWEKFQESSTEGRDPEIEVGIGLGEDTIVVKVFFIKNSMFDPYVLVEVSGEENLVIIIINALHPHFQELSSVDAVTNFVRHCVYDGVAEWKCIKKRGDILPNTVKFIKDGLLRVPYEMKQGAYH